MTTPSASSCAVLLAVWLLASGSWAGAQALEVAGHLCTADDAPPRVRAWKMAGAEEAEAGALQAGVGGINGKLVFTGAGGQELRRLDLAELGEEPRMGISDSAGAMVVLLLDKKGCCAGDEAHEPARYLVHDAAGNKVLEGRCAGMVALGDDGSFAFRDERTARLKFATPGRQPVELRLPGKEPMDVYGAAMAADGSRLVVAERKDDRLLLQAFGRDGARRWTTSADVPYSGVPLAVAPGGATVAVLGRTVWIVFDDRGRKVAKGTLADGHASARFDSALDAFVLTAGKRALVIGQDGKVRREADLPRAFPELKNMMVETVAVGRDVFAFAGLMDRRLHVAMVDGAGKRLGANALVGPWSEGEVTARVRGVGSGPQVMSGQTYIDYDLGSDDVLGTRLKVAGKVAMLDWKSHRVFLRVPR